MKILFATDGSKHAEFAEKFLLDMLQDSKQSITIIAVSVCPAPDLHGIGFEIPSPVFEAVQECREQTAQRLSDLSARLWDHVDSVEKHLLDGHPSEEILKLIEETKPDLCVVGSHGWTFSERIFLGSVSDKLAKHADCPVLIARPKGNQFDNPGCQRILIADDGSAGASNALARLESLPSTKSRSVRIVSVIEDSFTIDAMIPEQYAAILEQKKAAAEIRLKRDAAELSVVCDAVDYEIRLGSSASKELLKAADEFDADLILLGGKPKSLLERTFLGSVTLSVLHHSQCSVWIER